MQLQLVLINSFIETCTTYDYKELLKFKRNIVSTSETLLRLNILTQIV